MPGHNLLLEAGVVGATLVPVYGVVCKAVDGVMGYKSDDYKSSHSQWMLKVALTGFLYHTLAEAYGMNDWFLSNSVAKQKEERKAVEEIFKRRKTRYNYENYAVPLIPGDDRRTPMGDKWATASFTTSPAIPNTNAVQQFDVQKSL